jgi:DNA-binding MarR family transcriptional regulator
LDLHQPKTRTTAQERILAGCMADRRRAPQQRHQWCAVFSRQTVSHPLAPSRGSRRGRWTRFLLKQEIEMTSEEKAQVIVNATDKVGNLNFMQFRIMLGLHLIEVEIVSEIANRLRTKQSLISRNLDGLETKGFIKRIRDEKEDRRRVYVTLTNKGSKFVESALA